MKVLITGASGRVGTAVRPYLRRNFDLRLTDLQPPAPACASNEELHLGDLADPAAVAAAVAGVDAVIHLACVHGLGLDFDASLDANYRGTLNLLQESAHAGVKRFVYASSHHVLGAYPRAGFSADGKPVAPDAFYGLSKAFGEAACAMYALRFGLPTFVVRIGNADPRVGDERSLRMWTSAKDLAELFTLGLRMPGLGHEVVYGTSICPEPLFDNRRAFELGYQPRDRSDDNLAPDYLGADDMGPERGRQRVGGAYAVAPLPRVQERS
ncbi:MAG TPA: NAD(P)-dependent oxidoreductase [Trueperaceae bacterium]|nr:NAD(P)-dependent oxidoreductase [Trueperaceae bacterium]